MNRRTWDRGLTFAAARVLRVVYEAEKPMTQKLVDHGMPLPAPLGLVGWMAINKTASANFRKLGLPADWQDYQDIVRIPIWHERSILPLPFKLAFV